MHGLAKVLIEGLNRRYVLVKVAEPRDSKTAKRVVADK